VKYEVSPAFALAVAHVESGTASQEFRVGLLGATYYGPMGIHKCFLNRWPIDDFRENIRVGVKALRGRNLRHILKRYNAAFTESYWRAVKSAERRYRQEGFG